MAAQTIVIRHIQRNLSPERVFWDRRNPLNWMDEDQFYTSIPFRHQELLMIVDELANDVAFDARRKGSLFNLVHAL